MSDYEDILSKSWGEIPKPMPLPTGSWRLRGSNASFQPARDPSKSDSVLFVYTPIEPMDDVDADGLAELGSNYDVANNRIFCRFWVDNSVDWDKIRSHLVKHGVDAEGSIGDTLKAFKNTEVVAYLTQKSYVRATGEQAIDNVPTGFVPVE